MLYLQGYPFVLVPNISFGANLASKQTSCKSMKELFPIVITRFTSIFTDRECITTVRSASFCGPAQKGKTEESCKNITFLQVLWHLNFDFIVTNARGKNKNLYYNQY